LTELRVIRGAGAEVFAFRPLLGYLALATFAGIRPEEIKRSPVESIHLAERTALVAGAVAKTKRRRVVDLSENACAWLALWRGLCPAESLIIPKNFRRLWERLRARVGLDDWPHDVLRHTFASMHFAYWKDRARLQAELGHSADEDTLERHYKGVRTLGGEPISRGMAERFWTLFPPPRYREKAE
jgi:integrase